MKIIKKRIAELEGAQLDWAVAAADGNTLLSHIECGVAWQHLTDLRSASVREVPRYCSDWEDGGPIIERENIWLAAPTGVRTQWSAAVGDATDAIRGPTPLIAAMRAFVASKLGDEVEVPE